MERAEKLCPDNFKGGADTIFEIRFRTIIDTFIQERDSFVYITQKKDTIRVTNLDTMFRVVERPSNDTIVKSVNVYRRTPEDIRKIMELKKTIGKLQKEIKAKHIKLQVALSVLGILALLIVFAVVTLYLMKMK